MADQHPIQGLMTTAMENIREMVDVNTIVGDAVQAPDGTVIIPISRVSFGFAAGGGEYSGNGGGEQEKNYGDGGTEGRGKYPFAGGSGGGVSISPVAFMVVGQQQIRLLPVTANASLDRIIDLIPRLVEKANESVSKRLAAKKEKENNIKQEAEESS